MYFDFVYGILFDGRIITRKTRKSHRNTEKKESVGLDTCSSLPSPHTESTEINRIHEKGAGAGWTLKADAFSQGGLDAKQTTSAEAG